MEKINTVITKMIHYYQGDTRRIAHFLKVYALAKSIGEAEQLDPFTQEILEIAAVTHDIGIKISEEKYGNTLGSHQQIEGPPIARNLLESLAIPEAIISRVCYLISKHHTYKQIKGLDYQILVEADFLVNLDEENCNLKSILHARKNIFKTATGISYLKYFFIDGIIFDVDGTLWDSTQIVADSWNEVIQKESDLDITVTAEQLISLFGRPLDEIARCIFPTLAPEEQVRLEKACCNYENQVLETKCGILYPYLEEVLSYLSKRYPLFLVSNCQSGYIEAFLKVTGFGKYFKDFTCPGETGLLKADNLHIIMKRNRLKRPLYIGDTDGDYQACTQAGVPMIFASYGFGNVTDPDYSIDSLLELKDIL